MDHPDYIILPPPLRNVSFNVITYSVRFVIVDLITSGGLVLSVVRPLSRQHFGGSRAEHVAIEPQQNLHSQQNLARTC